MNIEEQPTMLEHRKHAMDDVLPEMVEVMNVGHSATGERDDVPPPGTQLVR